MEVACSLEDVARVLADNGYNFNDDSCFDSAVDLPSVISALDSPDSFPESPCSDEDIARVLDIARIPSPSLLDTCTSGAHAFPLHQHHYLPSPREGHVPYGVTIPKTRDPCIGNALLQTPVLPNLHPTSELTSLDLFSLALSSSLHDDNSPNFNTIVHAKDNDSFDNYANSSSALSPVSETDTLLPGPSEPFTSIKQPHQRPTHSLSAHITNDSSTQSLANLPSTSKITSTGTIPNHNTSIPEPSEAVTTQTKRKRRRKSNNVTPKPKRRKQQDNSNVTPKPKPTPKPKSKANKKDADSSNGGDSKSCIESTTKRKCTNSNSGRKTKKSKSNSATLETITENEIGTDATGNVDSISEIGSTNGVVEDTKGPRRSSRSTKNMENYNLRLSSLVKRVQTERKQQEPKQPKGKVKPPPLSKYRRRTANARERDRMKEINEAYEVLQQALPDMEPEDGKTKITKFTILKLALNYIASLQDILGLDPERPNPLNECATELQNDSSDNISSDNQSCSNTSTFQDQESVYEDISSVHDDTRVHNDNCGDLEDAVGLGKQSDGDL